MLPVATDRQNFIYKGSSPDVGDLPGMLKEDGSFISWWRPSPEEMENLNNGGYIELAVYQQPIPPFAINGVMKEDADGHP